MPPLGQSDQQLLALLSTPAPQTIPDVITRMTAIDELLPSNDGLKWFNRLYLMVTQQVDLNPPNGAWQSPLWFTQLDVIFAGLYFSAVTGYLTGQPIPASWAAVFEARFRPIDRIQFALAGMNAHINHDLAQALIAADSAVHITPTYQSLEYADYTAVNTLLNATTPAALTMLATDTLGVLAQDTGKIGRVLAFWNMCAARNMAWDFAATLRTLPPLTHPATLRTQDTLTGVLGKAILAFA